MMPIVARLLTRLRTLEKLLSSLFLTNFHSSDTTAQIDSLSLYSYYVAKKPATRTMHIVSY